MAVKVLSTEIHAVAKYPNEPITASALQFAFTAPTVASDGVQFPVTGREIIMCWNSDGVNPYTITIAGARDEYGMLQNLTTYSLAAGEFCVLPAGYLSLYAISSGSMTITMSNVAVKVAVLTIPANVAG